MPRTWRMRPGSAPPTARWHRAWRRRSVRCCRPGAPTATAMRLAPRDQGGHVCCTGWLGHGQCPALIGAFAPVQQEGRHLVRVGEQPQRGDARRPRLGGLGKAWSGSSVEACRRDGREAQGRSKDIPAPWFSECSGHGHRKRRRKHRGTSRPRHWGWRTPLSRSSRCQPCAPGVPLSPLRPPWVAGEPRRAAPCTSRPSAPRCGSGPCQAGHGRPPISK